MLLLRNVVLVHPGHPSDSRPIDLLLQDGRLHRLEPGGSMPTQGHTVAEAEDLHVSLSWIDTLASLNIPGHELRDSLEHLSASALQGGFSHVVVSPNSHPPIDHAEAVLALLARAATLPTTLLPMGAASEGTQGKEMAELASMQQAGACLISDGWQPLQAAGLQYRILRYLAPLQLPMHQLPMLESLEAGGVANESPAITRLGLKASPILAETLAVQQLLELLRHTEAELYLCPITAADSVARIRQAKADGLRVTAGTLPAYLYFTDEQLGDFDTRYKLRPPLRSEQDRLALLEAVADGTLDILASGHSPATIDEKRLEFDFAAYGMPMLETCYA
ncbi:MAG: dihydroorotase, partial [Sphingobacteriia bacterium]